MNTFKQLMNLCNLYEDDTDKENRILIKKNIADIVSDIVSKTVSYEDIEILRRDNFGFKAVYFDGSNEKMFKMNFSIMTNKAYIYDGNSSFEFKVF